MKKSTSPQFNHYVFDSLAAIMRANAQPIADVLVKEVAKPASDAYTGD